ncbi:MAG: flagellar assembly protein FliW [Candidatus Melainabacteria bacterium HGW-Melainabacteria-1]|nr:MAG: flagellar assembly protein FliW [Candidatus Melainabacteria bacterium HGW-Melainabacteria-1]
MTTITGVPALQPITRELTFVEQGLLGFEALLRYELTVYDPETPFYWLRSLEDEQVAFVVMEPIWLLEDYDFELSEDDARLMAVTAPQDVFVLLLCTVPEEPLDMTANLLGPLVFNRHNNLGRQLILDRQRYPLRYPLFQPQDPETESPTSAAVSEPGAAS